MTGEKLTLAQVLERAIARHQAGDLAEAERLYKVILTARPDQFNALQLLAVVEHQRGRHAEALPLVDRALAANPDDVGALNNRAAVLQGLERLEEAVASYDRALALRPDYVEVLYNRGLVLQKLGRGADALASLDKALALRPTYPDALLARGNVLRDLMRLEDALSSYAAASAMAPEQVDILLARAGVLCRVRRYDEALSCLAAARTRGPDSPQLFYLQGLACYELGRNDDAVACLDRALDGNPDHADTHFLRGNALFKQGRFREALASFDRALALKPDHADALLNRSNCKQQLGRHQDAVTDIETALTAMPPTAEALYGRGLSLDALNRWEEALAAYGHALALDPSHAKARLALVIAELPVLYRYEGEIAERRAAYAGSLKAWCDAVDASQDVGALVDAVGSRQPFFLPYQGENDRELQALYGAHVCRIMAARYPPLPLSPPPAENELIRVGIVSGFFYYHSNWRAPISGWLSRLDRRKFRMFGYYTGGERDAVTETARNLCERFVEGLLSIDRWRETIDADRPHVLIFPEVGMDPVACRLAAQRLAPVQCNAWGHPETSGFPTLDYYLSSDLMEPPDGGAHYTERLVRLPNLSVYYDPPAYTPTHVSRSDVGFRQGAKIYWSGQSLYKYLPQFDSVFCRIARDVADCQFVFVGHQQGAGVTSQFKERLARVFAAHRLNYEHHCVFLPRMHQRELIAAIGRCDVVLDTIGWSGFNSILETLPHDLPIVTLAGRFMRGRHASAVLQTIGVTETIAATVDDYVAIAQRLAKDDAFRLGIKRKVAQGKERAFRDQACIAGLERFLESVRSGPIADGLAHAQRAAAAASGNA